MSIFHNDLIFRVLSDLSEDHIGLWEVFWGARTTFPNLSESEQREKALECVRYLVEADLAQFFINTKENVFVKSQKSKIDLLNWLVSTKDSFYPPPVHNLWLGITQKGEKEYFTSSNPEKIEN